MPIAHKEAREAAYWLELLQASETTPASRLQLLIAETSELTKIISSILLSMKQGRKSHS